jgi:pterin-4a-carbinolamine dehydratase
VRSSPEYLRGLREFVEYDVAPIRPTTRNWTVVGSPRRLHRTFEFEDHRIMCVFIVNVLQYQDEMQHYAKMTIEFPTVTVELYTHDINDVTSQDKQLAQSFDSVYDECILGGLDVTGPVQDLY